MFNFYFIVAAMLYCSAENFCIDPEAYGEMAVVSVLQSLLFKNEMFVFSQVECVLSLIFI